MKTIKCAVIGVGYIGKFHAEKFVTLPQTELVAVVDVDKTRAQEIATAVSANALALTDYRDLVGKVDAVSIAVPTKHHHEIAKFCLSHGIHVLLEKPMTRTLEEAEELIAIARHKGATLQIGHLERFNAANLALKGILKEPLFIESHRLSPYNPRVNDVNVVLDLMIHDIDLISSMVKAPIVSLDACGTPILSNDIDIANARIKFENGCIANVTASRASLKTERRIKLFQHDAYLVVDFLTRKVIVHRKGEEEMFPGIPEITRESQTFAQSDAIKAEIEAFIHSITMGTRPVVNGEDGKHALETAIKITEMLHEQLAFVKSKHPQYFQGDHHR